jgi:hypothetical protein
MSKSKSTKPATTSAGTDHAPLETTTSWKTQGPPVTATTHAACAGKGCAECHGLGFTTQTPTRAPGLGL